MKVNGGEIISHVFEKLYSYLYFIVLRGLVGLCASYLCTLSILSVFVVTAYHSASQNCMLNYFHPWFISPFFFLVVGFFYVVIMHT